MSDLLFIDDNRDILEANRSYFEEQGFHATACESGEAAVTLIKGRAFDCIVLDVMMPGMDGYGVCKAIREKTDTPVIFLSCLDQPDDKVRGLMLGGDAYMVKPYDLRELHAQVIACIRRGEKAAAPAPCAQRHPLEKGNGSADPSAGAAGQNPVQGKPLRVPLAGGGRG